VDAVETPFGRYHRKLSNLIGSRWQLYLQEHPKDVGEVTILVLLDTSGKVTATRVIANHSMDDLAELSTRAILESDLPPVPDDLAPMLRDGKLEITFNFNVYDPNDDSTGR
jgi:Gram-negative bacterial TonB protein C-terminal